MAFAENALFKSYGVIYSPWLPSTLPDELSTDIRNSSRFLSRQRVSTFNNSFCSFCAEGFALYFVWGAVVVAISSTSPQIDGVSVGQYPLIVRLLKGAFHLRPPNPKYRAIWPVHKIRTIHKFDIEWDWLSNAYWNTYHCHGYKSVSTDIIISIKVSPQYGALLCVKWF